MTMHEDAPRRAFQPRRVGPEDAAEDLGAGAVAMAGIPLLAACTGGSAPASSGSQDGHASVPAPRTKSPRPPTRPSPTLSNKKSGVKVNTNVVPHNDFQNKINTYLQGSPDDAFTWFAGYRMQYYAGKGLLAPIDDVWEKIGGNFSDALKKASTGADGKMYLSRTTTTPGVSSTGRASGPKRATRSRPPSMS